ncbi:MAG TPA: hypothetical protein VGK89_03110 [Candidatus Eisenbacteria bacterium]|jgi:hypothetical protein
MDFPIWLQPSAAGLALAAAAVATGAPLFSDGLRALRLRRLMPRLREVPLGGSAAGLVHVRGAVRLESPLFSPLSGAPCAGFRLEVRSAGTRVARAIDVFRPFRIAAGGASADVRGTKVRWALSETATRDVQPDQPLSQNLAALIGRVPEAQWLRRSRLPLRLTERALLEGAECHVVGYARAGYEREAEEELELARTGTYDAAPAPALSMMSAGRAFAGPPAAGPASPAHPSGLRIDAGEGLDFLLVSDRPPDPRQLAVARLRVANLAIGPVLSLAGMIYLAFAADSLGALGRR